MQQLSVLSESVNIQDSLKKASILLPLCVAVILVGWRVVFTLITAPPTGGGQSTTEWRARPPLSLPWSFLWQQLFSTHMGKSPRELPGLIWRVTGGIRNLCRHHQTHSFHPNKGTRRLQPHHRPPTGICGPWMFNKGAYELSAGQPAHWHHNAYEAVSRERVYRYCIYCKYATALDLLVGQVSVQPHDNHDLQKGSRPSGI